MWYVNKKVQNPFLIAKIQRKKSRSRTRCTEVYTTGLYIIFLIATNFCNWNVMFLGLSVAAFVREWKTKKENKQFGR